MGAQVTTLVPAALDVIADPTSNLTAAVFLMAAVVLLVLIVVLVAIIAMLPGARRHHTRAGDGNDRAGGGESAAEDDPVAPAEGTQAPVPVSRRTQRGRSAGGTWVIAIGMVAALGSGYVATAQSSYCLACHDGARPEEQGTPHADVACIRCHEDTLALATNTVRRGLDIVAHYGLVSSAYDAHVPSARCYSCHRDIDDGTVLNEESGVMMSHAEPLEAGYACADCHHSGSHADMAAPIGMTVCIACHDSETASAACDTCHAKDTSAASRRARERIYGTAKITRTDCEGCHSMDVCTPCHDFNQ